MLSQANTVEKETGVYSLRWALVFISLVTLYRIYYLSLGAYDLYIDEAQYWWWAKNLDWGYYSKPPMVAWAIALTTSLCGDGELCIRLSSPLAHAATSVFVYFIALEWFDKRVAFYSAIAYLTFPAITLSSTLVSTDPFLMLFWGVTTFATIKTLKTGYWRWAIMAGLGAGCGMLSKYNFLFFLPSTLLFLSVTPHYRHFLKNPRLYAAALLAFLVYAPNLLWNINNEFASYIHTGDNAHLHGQLFNPGKMLEFIGAQFIVFGPVMFAVLLWCILRAKSLWKDEHTRLMLCLIIPFFVTIVTISFISRAHANWAAPIYVPGTVLVTAWLLEKGRYKWLNASILLHLVIAGVFYNYHATLSLLNVELTRKLDPFFRIQGWEELGEAVTAIRSQHPDAHLLVDTRKLAAELTYYANPKPQEVLKWNADGVTEDHWDLTTSLKGMEGQNFLLITEARPRDRDQILSRFENAEKLPEIEIPIHSDYHLYFYVYYLQNFRGYR